MAEMYLPDDVIMYLIDVGGYETLKSIASTNRFFRNYVKRKFKREVKFAISVVNPIYIPVIEELYHLNSNMSADPAGIIIKHDNGFLIKYKTVNGKVNKIVSKDLNGARVFEKWTVNDMLSRIDGPAWWEKDDDYSFQLWARNGKMHRLGAPAKIKFDRFFREEIWAIDGKARARHGLST